MIAAIGKLPAKRKRLLAVALLVVAVVLVLAVLLGPLVLLHKHYDDTIAELTDRIERYRRVAAQAPEYRKALDAMREKNGRRFFLKNTAANLAGAELQEQVRTAIESNGGRITTSQNQGPKDDGRFPPDRRHRAVLRVDPGAAEDPLRDRGAAAVPHGREHDAAPAQCVPRLPAGARPGAGDQRSARRRGVRVRRAREEVRAMTDLSARIHSALWWLVPLVALAAIIGWETRWGSAFERRPAPAEPIAPKPVVSSLLPEYAIVGGTGASTEMIQRTLFNPTRRPAPAAPEAGAGRLQRGQFALTGTLIIDGKSTAYLREVAGNKPRRVLAGDKINGMLVAEVKPDRVRLTLGDESEELVLKIAANPRPTAPPGAPAAAAERRRPPPRRCRQPPRRLRRRPPRRRPRQPSPSGAAPPGPPPPKRRGTPPPAPPQAPRTPRSS